MPTSTYQQNPKQLDGVPDLCQLVYLQEPNVLHNLQHRYKSSKIYTSTTAKVLVAVNPYERIPGLDSDEVMAKYQKAPINLEGLMTDGGLEPHTFTVANCAYHNMIMKQKNQSVIVCGESGSGKTESAKLLMKFLAYTSTATSTDPRQFQEAQKIGKQVLDANPILETFGNAKTVLNNNSSRFGKFTKMLFAERPGSSDAQSRQLIGAAIETYLLEKSRVVRQDPGERNYHAFYQLLTQAKNHPEWQLGEGNPQNFHFLNQSGCFTLDGTSDTDARDFKDLISAFDTLRIPKNEQDEVLALVAGVLHLGNVTIKSEGVEGSKIGDTVALQKAADLFGVEASKLSARLTTRSITVRNNTMIKPLKEEDAISNRDSIAKALYNALFFWIVDRINQESNPGERNGLSWIGTLDVFGFEIFEQNSFEQFCINFANERLQSFFNYHVLKSEQDLYRKEALIWTPVDLPDNLDVIDLIMDKPSGIFAVLDSACVQPQGTDEVFTHNVFQNHPSHPRLQQVLMSPRKSRRGSQANRFNGFCINHYAGQVTYDAKEFLFKNNDTQHPDTIALFSKSKSTITKNVLVGISGMALGGNSKKSFKFLSTSNVFSTQLESLMNNLGQTTPYFVRCIKPNDEKMPKHFMPEYVRPQLRCGGLVEALRIIKCGFPTRCSYARITEQFAPTIAQMPSVTNLNKRDFTEAMIHTFANNEMIDRSQYQLGLTMIFFKPGMQAFFQRILNLKNEQISAVQRAELHQFLVQKRIIRMRGTVKSWIRVRHFIIFRRLQKAASIMSIIGRTMFRTLRRVRRRLFAKHEEAENMRLLKDQKYQEALAAVGQLDALKASQDKLKAALQREAQAVADAQNELNSSQHQVKAFKVEIQELTRNVGDLERSLAQAKQAHSLVQNQLQDSQLSAIASESQRAMLEAELERESSALKQAQEMLHQLQKASKQQQEEFLKQSTEGASELAQAKAQVRDLETEVMRLQARTAKNSEEASQMEEELQARLQEEKETSRAREANMEQSLREKEAAIMELSSRLKMLQSEYEAVQVRFADYEQSSSGAMAKAKANHKRLEEDYIAAARAKDQELSELQELYDEQRREKGNFESSLMEANLKAQRTADELARAESLAEQNQTRLQNLLAQKEEEFDQLVQAKRRSSMELDTVTRKSQELEATMQQEVNNLKTQVNDLREQLRSAEEDAGNTIRRLKKEIRELTQGEDGMEQLKAQLVNLQAQLSSTKATAERRVTLQQEAHVRDMKKKEQELEDLRTELAETVESMDIVHNTMSESEASAVSKFNKLKRELEDAEYQLTKHNSQLQASNDRAVALQASLDEAAKDLCKQNNAAKDTQSAALKQINQLQTELNQAEDQAVDNKLRADSEIQRLNELLQDSANRLVEQERRFTQELKSQRQELEILIEEAQDQAQAERMKMVTVANGATEEEVEEWTYRLNTLERELVASRENSEALDDQLHTVRSQLHTARRQLAEKQSEAADTTRRLHVLEEEHADSMRRAARRIESSMTQMAAESNSSLAALQSELNNVKRELRNSQAKETHAQQQAKHFEDLAHQLRTKARAARESENGATAAAEEMMRTKVRMAEIKYQRELKAMEFRLEAAESELREVEAAHSVELEMAGKRLRDSVAYDEAIATMSVGNGKTEELQEKLEQLQEDNSMLRHREQAFDNKLSEITTKLVATQTSLKQALEEKASFAAAAEAERQQAAIQFQILTLQTNIDTQTMLTASENKVASLEAENNMLRLRVARLGFKNMLAPSNEANTSASPTTPSSALKLSNVQMFHKADSGLEASMDANMMGQNNVLSPLSHKGTPARFSSEVDKENIRSPQ